MGLTYIEIEVGNVADPSRTEKIECLVDSGAIYSVIPADVLASSRSPIRSSVLPTGTRSAAVRAALCIGSETPSVLPT
jgi:hypothetical protein